MFLLFILLSGKLNAFSTVAHLFRYANKLQNKIIAVSVLCQQVEIAANEFFKSFMYFNP